MTSQSVSPGDANLDAGRLAAAMLRFQEPLAHLMSASARPGTPIVGVDAYVFLPSSRRVQRADVPAYLAGLQGAAFIATTTTRGMLALVLLDELGAERRASLQKELDNQYAGVVDLARGRDTDRVLLEFDEEASLFSLAGVRRWAQRFVITVGWSIEPCPEPERAEWRVNLLGGDGRRRSKGFGRS